MTENALLRLWREKRGEVEPQDLSGNLIVQLGVVTEDLNRRWYEANTGQSGHDIQRRFGIPVVRWMAATLDGRGEQRLAPCSKPSSCCPGRSRKKRQGEIYAAAAAQYVGHGGRSAVLSVITGGGKWVEITIPCRSALPAPIVTAETKFWRCVESGEPPRPVRGRTAKAAHRGGPDRRYEHLQRLGGICRRLLRTRTAHLEHEKAKAELKALMPEDAQQAIGHGIRAKRSKSGAISFDLLKAEGRPCSDLARRSARSPPRSPRRRRS